MQDLARVRGSGDYHYAGEIAFDDSLLDVEWQCLGCNAEMVAVAADGARVYEKAPHFRLPRGVGTMTIATV